MSDKPNPKGPRIKPDDAHAYARLAALPEGTVLTVNGKRATVEPMTGNLITLKFRGRAGIVYLRAGMPIIKEIAASIPAATNYKGETT